MRSEHAGPDAVLFDMDGTLVDTEGLWWQATASIAASLGRPLGAEDMPYVLGRTVEDVAAHLLTPAPSVPALMTEVVRQLTDAFADLIEQGVKVTPGASELLAELAATAIPTALVSASPRAIVELVLPRLGHPFDLVIANEDTARGKPYPDPYLEAARRLGTTPARCVAVEDSPTGIAAATAAGCRVLVTSPEKGLPSLTHLLTANHPPEPNDR
ncbi:HAD family hydrolase [Nonomuraea sp. JJY05]|jgi:HAD superfamily hydrolase (TIGR01509 family)|uniref:HAD family hydrolase n=1 Tax=Nonomuraea sp. JJY05 TaxID=3350255 RepID=UPI00373E7F9C